MISYLLLLENWKCQNTAWKSVVSDIRMKQEILLTLQESMHLWEFEDLFPEWSFRKKTIQDFSAEGLLVQNKDFKNKKFLYRRYNTVLTGEWGPRGIELQLLWGITMFEEDAHQCWMESKLVLTEDIKMLCINNHNNVYFLQWKLYWNFLLYLFPLTNIFIFISFGKENQMMKYWSFHSTWIPVFNELQLGRIAFEQKM